MSKKIALLIVSVFLVFPCRAQAEGSLKLIGTVFEVKVKGEEKVERKTVTFTELTSGMEVFSVMTYKNIGEKPVKDVVITDPVPKALEYISASISKSGGLSADLSVSVDGGKTYGDLSRLTVPVVDGEPRAAEPKEVTHVRWLLKTMINPEEEIYVSFRTRVK